MRNVLTIEGNERVTGKFVRTLMEGGFSVDVACSGRAGVTRLMAHHYDAVILDRALPDLDGLAVVATLRGIGMEIPVLMMSATSDAGQRIEGLRAGADDYLCMPFSCEEMLVRMEVLLRRRPSVPAAQPVLRVDALELDLVKREMAHQQSTLYLQPTEFQLLEFLMRHAGQVLTRTMIREAVWGIHFDTSTNRIDVHVGQLRKKIASLGAPPMIHTVRGSGYRLG
jgi:two-component system OmpR family response regulator